MVSGHTTGASIHRMRFFRRRGDVGPGGSGSSVGSLASECGSEYGTVGSNGSEYGTVGSSNGSEYGTTVGSNGRSEYGTVGSNGSEYGTPVGSSNGRSEYGTVGSSNGSEYGTVGSSNGTSDCGSIPQADDVEDDSIPATDDPALIVGFEADLRNGNAYEPVSFAADTHTVDAVRYEQFERFTSVTGVPDLLGNLRGLWTMRSRVIVRRRRGRGEEEKSTSSSSAAKEEESTSPASGGAGAAATTRPIDQQQANINLGGTTPPSPTLPVRNTSSGTSTSAVAAPSYDDVPMMRPDSLLRQEPPGNLEVEIYMIQQYTAPFLGLSDWNPRKKIMKAGCLHAFVWGCSYCLVSFDRVFFRREARFWERPPAKQFIGETSFAPNGTRIFEDEDLVLDDDLVYHDAESDEDVHKLRSGACHTFPWGHLRLEGPLIRRSQALPPPANEGVDLHSQKIHLGPGGQVVGGGGLSEGHFDLVRRRAKAHFHLEGHEYHHEFEDALEDPPRSGTRQRQELQSPAGPAAPASRDCVNDGCPGRRLWWCGGGASEVDQWEVDDFYGGGREFPRPYRGNEGDRGSGRRGRRSFEEEDNPPEEVIVVHRHGGGPDRRPRLR